MRLKTKPKKRDERDPEVCSASRCTAEPTTIDGTKKRDPHSDVYFCDRHWAQLCDDEDAEHEAERMIARAYRLKPGQSSLEPGRYVMQHTDEGLEVVT